MKRISPAEREQQILDMLARHGSVSVTELAERFAVSQMTIHRDLQRLEHRGYLHKRRGGAMRIGAEMSGPACAICGKQVTENQRFLIHLENGDSKNACCAHCGLMLLSMEKSIHLALAMDFLYCYRINADQAFYLLEPEIHLCCIPTILTFGSRHEAERFQRGFGGRLVTIQEASQYLTKTLREKTPWLPSDPG